MTNPTVPDDYTNVREAKVTIGRHVIVGTGTTILPGVHIGDGVAVGAMSLVNTDLEPWKMYWGIPVKCMRNRSRKLLDVEKRFQDEFLK